MLPRQRDLLAGSYEWGIVEGAGHFVHREKPVEASAAILDCLAR
jgi:pimeloyl-ACP methyl ester carboxylesterase